MYSKFQPPVERVQCWMSINARPLSSRRLDLVIYGQGQKISPQKEKSRLLRRLSWLGWRQQVTLQEGIHCYPQKVFLFVCKKRILCRKGDIHAPSLHCHQVAQHQLGWVGAQKCAIGLVSMSTGSFVCSKIIPSLQNSFNRHFFGNHWSVGDEKACLKAGDPTDVEAERISAAALTKKPELVLLFLRTFTTGSMHKDISNRLHFLFNPFRC